MLPRARATASQPRTAADPMMTAHALRRPAPRRLLRAAAVLGLLVLPLAAPSPAAAQNAEVRSLTNKVERLQRELNTLQRQVYSGEAPAAPEGGGQQAAPSGGGTGLSQAAAQRLNSRLSSLEQEIQRMTGRLEETQYRVRQLTDRMDKLVQDVDYRLTQLEQAAGTAQTGGQSQANGGGQQQGGQTQAQTQKQTDGSGTGQGRQTASSGQAGGQGQSGGQAASDGSQSGSASDSGSGGGGQTLGTVSEDAVAELRENRQQGQQGQQSSGNGDGTQTAVAPSAEEVLPDAAPKEQYEHAFGLLRQADYQKAERALQAFLDAHPDHQLAGNAKYWLGETYYVRGNYDQAAVTFAEGFQNYAESQKAPDNLLKLGMSLAQIDRTEDACGIFGELLSRYPDAANNILQRAKREQQRLGCGG